MSDTILQSSPSGSVSSPKGTDHINRLEAADKSKNVPNVGNIERVVSMVSGGALLLFGLSRRSAGGLTLAAVGSGLLYRGATGHCSVYDKLNVSTADAKQARGVHVETAITIGKSPEELYRFWRDLTNLPRFMEHLQSVEVTGPTTSHWTAKAPIGQTVSWNAEILVDEPNSRISWRSLPDADIDNTGTVRFVPAPAGRGCEVHVTLQYYPPAGALGAGIAKLFGEEPSIQIEDDLRRLKRLLETGEIPTTEGQPHG